MDLHIFSVWFFKSQNYVLIINFGNLECGFFNLDSRISVLLITRVLIDPFRRCRIRSLLTSTRWVGSVIPRAGASSWLVLTRRLCLVHLNVCPWSLGNDGPRRNIRALVPVARVCGPLTSGWSGIFPRKTPLQLKHVPHFPVVFFAFRARRNTNCSSHVFPKKACGNG